MICSKLQERDQDSTVGYYFKFLNYKLQLSTCPSLSTIYFDIWKVSSSGSCSQLVKRQFLIWIAFGAMEGLASLDLRHVCNTFATLHWSILFRISARHFYMFCLDGLPHVNSYVYCYEGCSSRSCSCVLVECCSFFSFNFEYSSDPLHNVNIYLLENE